MSMSLANTQNTQVATKLPNGKQKSAILLANLGPEVSADVLKLLPPNIVERVIAEMMQLKRYDPMVTVAVIEEGLERSGIATFGSVGGIDVARQILARAIGPSAADDIIKRLSAQGGYNAPFQFLRDVDRNQLADFLLEEHPQTIALVIAKMSPDLAANILQRMESSTRAEIAYRIATMEAAPPELVRDVEEMMKLRLSGAISRGGGASGGVDFLVQVLMRSDRQTEKNLLDHLDATVPEIAEQIRSKMFVFEDIAKLEDRAIQRIIREVDMKELARAMRGVKEDVRVTIYRNMSSRAAEMMRDELDTMGPMRSDQVSRAQRSIVNTIRRLEDQEEIVISRSDEELM